MASIEVHNVATHLNIWGTASTSHQGISLLKYVRIASTLGVPTSCSVAMECLLSDDRVTWSKSTRLRVYERAT